MLQDLFKKHIQEQCASSFEYGPAAAGGGAAYLT